MIIDYLLMVLMSFEIFYYILDIFSSATHPQIPILLINLLANNYVHNNHKN